MDFDNITDELMLNIDIESLMTEEHLIGDQPEKTVQERSNESLSPAELCQVFGDVPLAALRGGYLCVSDLTGQMWCECQLIFRLLMPIEDMIVQSFKEPPVEEIPGRVLLLDESVIRKAFEQLQHQHKGSDIHRKRELEVEKYVKVDIESREDALAVKMYNLFLALKRILNMKRSVCREVPIFGVVEGILFLGKIDEIRIDVHSFSLSVVEFKTRVMKKPPGHAQRETHNLQVMMYKLLFDNLVRGTLLGQSLFAALGLDMKRRLGKGITKDIRKAFRGMTSIQGDTVITLEWLLNELMSCAAALPFIDKCFIDYSWQEDEETFLSQEVEYNEVWLSGKLKDLLGFWKGKRACRGADIEEAWKCHNCVYYSLCEWAQSRSGKPKLSLNPGNQNSNLHK